MKKKIEAQLGEYKKVYSERLRINRIEFDDLQNPALRKQAEIEAGRDLVKPVEQLLADVHEEAEGNPNELGRIVGTNKRLASMMLAVVKSNDRVTIWIIIITIISVISSVLQLRSP